MGQREVSDTAELSATEAATRLLPLLKEYAGKLAAVAEGAPAVLDKLALQSRETRTTSALEAGRLVCLHDTLQKPVTDLAREASGLIEHSALEHYLRAELKLRLDELEEHIRFSALVVGELIGRIHKNPEQAGWLRLLVVNSGRYSAPF